MTDGLPETGVEGFLAGLRRCACGPTQHDSVIAFEVIPITGSRAGLPTQTGVSVDELIGWPSIPPHWIHLPADVTFAITNSQPSPVPGWLMHSRSITGWGNAQEPAQAWIAHARAVIGEAN